MTDGDRLRGTLLGTALGDALGLPAEGMSAHAIARRFGRVDRFRLLGRVGYVSDDTEQSALLAAALARHPRDLPRAVVAFRRSLLGWFLRLPWGIGLGTLRACTRIALGLSRSGVASAGNGAAMRAAVVGVFFREDAALRRTWSDALAQVTHVDARAVEGARFVAEVAAAATRDGSDPERCLAAGVAVVEDPALREALERSRELRHRAASTGEAAAALGVTGYAVHTVSFAAFCFGRFGSRSLDAIVETIAAGGDTDSIAAIVGAWCGALHGERALPSHLVARLASGPFGPAHLRALGDALAAAARGEAAAPVRFAWPLALVRNLALYPVVLAHGFRRLVPF